MHLIKCGILTKNYTEDLVANTSYCGQYMFLYKNDELIMFDIFKGFESQLELVDFPKGARKIYFSLANHRTYSVRFDVISQESYNCFYGKSYLDKNKKTMTLLNSCSINLTRLYNCSKISMDNSILEKNHEAFIHSSYADLTKTVEIYECDCEVPKVNKIASLKLRIDTAKNSIMCACLTQEAFCYFVKPLKSFYLPDIYPQKCFFKKFYQLDLKTGKRTSLQTRSFPNFEHDLNDYMVDRDSFWFFNKLNILFRQKISKKITKSYCPSKFVVFDSEILAWKQLEFPFIGLPLYIRLKNIDSNAVLTLVQLDKENKMLFYRCALRSPESLLHLAWFKHYSLNNSKPSPKILNVLPSNFLG